MAVDFSPYQAVLLDLDGTLLRQDAALPGAAALVDHLRAIGRPFAIITNSTAGPRRVAERLQAEGIAVPRGQVWTAAQAACDYVVAKARGNLGRPPRVMNLGTIDVDELLDGRAELVNAHGPCDAVIAGTPTNARAGEERQRLALRLLRDGAELVAVCADRVFPSARGLEFGSGAFTAMLAYAAGVRATYCGKPEKRFFLEVCRRLKVDSRQCLLIGDNLEADVLGGKAVGMRTILVLDGVTRRSDLEQLAPAMHPDAVVTGLTELVE